MLNVLGMGSARPKNLITNDLLVALGLAPSASHIFDSTGIATRHSTLSLEYILETKNADTSKARMHASETPTDLSIRAAEMAVASAGISKDAIGLIIGDSATPLQTTPSEAQRLGPRFGIKVPAFDISAASGALALTLEILSSWQEESIPEYVLLVSSNTPTQAIDYRTGSLPLYFGDCASAMIVSTRHSGRLKVRSATATISADECSDYVVDTYGHLALNEDIVFPRITRGIQRMISTESLRSFEPSHIFLPHLPFRLMERLWRESGLGGIVAGVEGLEPESFGSSSTGMLADTWDSLKAGERIAVLQSGLGISSGLVLLEGV